MTGLKTGRVYGKRRDDVDNNGVSIFDTKTGEARLRALDRYAEPQNRGAKHDKLIPLLVLFLSSLRVGTCVFLFVRG